jgi:cell division protein FtsQ
MANISSVSPAQLARRRRLVRQQRRRKFFHTAWQVLTIGSLTGAMIWFTTRPDWFIYQANEVVISGNQFLSAQAVKSLLPIAYPTSLLQLNPQEIAAKLESSGPIAQANVTRKLFPPKLIVEVQEKRPVAIAQIPSSTVQKPPSPQQKNQPIPPLSQNAQIGLLDENGVLISQSGDISPDQFLQLPTLTVIGDPKQYQPYWLQVYQAINRSPIKIYEIDWRDPNNLILKTELGIVHCGGQTSQLVEQLHILDKMRNLPAQVNPSQIDYIDLKNPQKPTIRKTP